MRRWLKIAGIGLAGLIVLAALLVTALLGTTPGARLVLTRMIPAEVRVADIDGRLWGPLVLEDVRYETPGVEARVARVTVDWRPTRLLLRRVLEITALEVDTADVWLRPTEPDEPQRQEGPTAWDRPTAPLTLRLEGIQFTALRVVTAAGDTARADRLVLAGGARQDTFDLDSLRVRDFDYRGGRFQVDAGGRIVTGATGARDSADLRLRWSGLLADGRRLAGQGTVRGAAGDLVLDHRLTEPVAANLDGEVRVPWAPDTLTWSAALDVPRFALDRLRAGVPGEAGLTARARGGLASAEATVEARGEHPAVGPAAADLRVGYRDGAVVLDTVRLRRPGAAGELHGRGRLALSDTGPSADARLAWRELGWPLDSPGIASPDGLLRLEGWVDGFRATAELGLRRADASLGRWTVRTDGRFADGRVVVPELVARRAGGGSLTLTADVALDDGPGGPRGRATVAWTDLAWPPGPGDSATVSSADGRIEVQGAIEDFSVVADAALSGAAIPLDRVRVDLRGDADDESVRARLSATGLAAGSPALELAAAGSYRFAGRLVLIDTLDARLPDTGGRLGLRGRADLSGDEPRVSARARWRDLGWPVRDPRYRSGEGEIDVETRDGAIRVAADALLGGATLPEGRWRLAGQGGMDRFAVDSLRGSLLGGGVRAAGVVWPDSGPAWDLEVTGDSLDPGRWRAGWDGSLGLRLVSRGRLAEAGPSFRLTLDRLDGTLRGRPVAARAEARGEAGRIDVDTLRIESGESTLSATGAVGDSLDVAWRLDAASLYDFVPDAVGALAARGRVTGPRDAPSIRLTAEGQGLTVAGWSADGLRATAELAAAGRDSSAAAVTLTGVRGVSLALDSVTLRANGTRAAHAASLLAASPDDVLEGRLDGGVSDDGHWDGLLSRFRLRSSIAGEWRLRDTARLAVGPDSGAVADFCWVGSGELCLGADWGPDGVRWRGSGQRLPMAFLRPGLPQGVTARGEFALETEGRTGAGPVPTGTFGLTAGAGEIDYSPDPGRTVTQRYDTLVVRARSDSAGIGGRAELRLGALGSVLADASLPGTGPVRERALDGRLQVQLADSGTVSRYVPALAESRGRLDADIRMAGTAAAPRLTGQVSLTEAGAAVTPAGIRLSDGRIEARSEDGGRWRLDGGVASDTSRLSIGGFVRTPSPDSAWLLSVSLEADAFPAVRTPDLRVVASPRLQLRASPDSIIVDGRVAVPSALIAVRELEGTAQASPDVVVVGADGEARDSAVTPASVRGTVELVLGDSVRIDALGLTGRMDGRLAIAAQPGRPPVGNGELALEDAEYRIYRQTFRIDQGRLLFASTPLSNPGLDLRVTRQSGEVTVGMDITGRASDPRVQLFSDPSLSDEEILAYLIVGRPLRRLSQSEGSQVQSMAQSVGVAGGNLLLARLGAAFGLETARIERTNPDDDGQRETRLILGRQVLPRVHLDYAIGLGEAANILRLRYMITDHWIFQTESGEETGADLLYTFGQ